MGSSIDMNNAGCASGPHGPRGTSAERASMQAYRISSATQLLSEHTTYRLTHGLPVEDRTRQILAQVNAIDAIMSPSSSTVPNGGN
ncbi:hypothetical protein NUW58_g1367 [Xylaria curta]|uniref:Uncharacterized protein n=1 Tax=Xylaria curta TaxID=42375 RepID=A0ACC1PMB4_9PEZI|nr:hypothetical protein NUW58_g1367 [Xylaria curta]